jgi:hypothetical protein
VLLKASRVAPTTGGAQCLFPVVLRPYRVRPLCIVLLLYGLAAPRSRHARSASRREVKAVVYVVVLMAVSYLVARYATIGLMRWRASLAAPPAPDEQDRSGPVERKLSASGTRAG